MGSLNKGPTTDGIDKRKKSPGFEPTISLSTGVGSTAVLQLLPPKKTILDTNHNFFLEGNRTQEGDGLGSGPISGFVAENVARFTAVRANEASHVLNKACKSFQYRL